MNETSRSVPPAGTLLVYAALGGFWAIGASVLMFVTAVLLAGGRLSALLVVVAVIVGPVFGVPLGLVAGAGALAGLAARRSPWAAGAGGGLAVALVASIGMLWMKVPVEWAWIPPALLVAVGALTPLSLRLAARRPQAPREPGSTWLIVGGLLIGTAALLVGPVLELFGPQVIANGRPENFGAFSSPNAPAPYPAAALALVGAIALVTGLWLTHRRAGGQGFLVSFLAIVSALGLLTFAVVQFAAISSDVL